MLASSVVRKHVVSTFQKVGRIVLIQKHMRTVLVILPAEEIKSCGVSLCRHIDVHECVCLRSTKGGP